jgi:hypothetical protein
MAATAKWIELAGHEASNGWAEGPGAADRPRCTLTVDFRVYDPGRTHVAGILYTTDLWGTRDTAMARFQRCVGPYGSGGHEVWRVTVELDRHVDDFEYVIFCDDHQGERDVARIYNTNGGALFHIMPAAL